MGLLSTMDRALEYETDCIQRAAKGHVDELCDLVDEGSLFTSITSNRRSQTDGTTVISSIYEGMSRKACWAGPDTVVTRQFGGLYFSWRQAIDLDSLLTTVHRLPVEDRDFFLGVVLSVASDIVNTVGKHFAQPIKLRNANHRIKHHLVRQVLRDRTMDVMARFSTNLRRFAALPKARLHHRAIRNDYRSVLRDKTVTFDAVYADPPYTRDHYSRFYHVLETMARHDDPSVSTTKIRSKRTPRVSRGCYRTARHQSPFCIKSQAPQAFEELFAGTAARGVPLVLSYSQYAVGSGNRPRVISVDELLRISKRFFARVECREVIGVAHNKFNIVSRNVRVDYPAELLFVCI